MIKYLSLFSGIGAFEKALENLGIKYDLVNFCEVDKFASKAYSLLHHIPQELNLGDIEKVDESALPVDLDLITYGFPCTDISIAGRKKGFMDENGQKTRSGLFFDALRIIEHCKPKIAIAENVKNLTSKSMKPVFDTVLDGLDRAGYNNYWKILDASDYGIPQRRKRVLIVSIRKDVDSKTFEFPPPIPATKCMGDFLDEWASIPEQYVLSSEVIKNVLRHNAKHSGHIGERGGYCPTLTASSSKYPIKVKCEWT